MKGQLQELLAERARYPDRLEVKMPGRVVIVQVESIHWIDAAGNYVKIHTAEEVLTLRETMSGIEKRLNPQMFLRIHRSTIVNIHRGEAACHEPWCKWRAKQKKAACHEPWCKWRAK